MAKKTAQLYSDHFNLECNLMQTISVYLSIQSSEVEDIKIYEVHNIAKDLLYTRLDFNYTKL